MYFRENFNNDAYNVNMWQRIKDVTGKGKISDTDVPLIDGLDGETVRDWSNLSDDEMKQEIKNLFPNLFEVKLVQLIQVPQSQQFVLLI